MSAVNCSYVDVDGLSQNLTCSGSSNNCCSSSAASKYCSESACDSDTSTNNELSAIVFWSILGGLFAAVVIIVALIYAVCYLRKPRECWSRDPLDEIFEETIETEVRTVTSQPRACSSQSSPEILLRTENYQKVTKRQRSLNNIFSSTQKAPLRVCASCGNATDTPKTRTNARRTFTSTSSIHQQNRRGKDDVTVELPKVAD